MGASVTVGALEGWLVGAGVVVLVGASVGLRVGACVVGLLVGSGVLLVGSCVVGLRVGSGERVGEGEELTLGQRVGMLSQGHPSSTPSFRLLLDLFLFLPDLPAQAQFPPPDLPDLLPPFPLLPDLFPLLPDLALSDVTRSQGS